MRQALLYIFLLQSIFGFAQRYNFTHLNDIGDFNNAYVYTITQADGYLWLGTSSGIYCYDGFEFNHFSDIDSLAGDFVTASTNVGDEVWFGHRSGALSILSNGKFRTIQLTSELPGSISQLVTVAKNEVWVATYSGGVFRVKSDQITHYPITEDYGINQIEFLDETRLLIGTDEGVYKAELGKEQVINLKNLVDIPRVKISAIRRLDSDIVIIGTEDMGVYTLQIEGENIHGKKIIQPEAYKEEMLSALLIDDNKNLWIGTFGGGVFLSEYKNAQWSRELISYPNQITKHVKCIYQDVDENIWLGNYGKGITKIVSNPFLVLQRGSDVSSISTDNNTLYFTQKNSVFKSSETENKDSELLFSIPSGTITTLETHGSWMWVGTDGDGVFQYDLISKELIAFDMGSDKLRKTINVIRFGESTLWIGTRKGLFSIHQNSNSSQWYSISSGQITHNVVNDIYIAKSSRVYVVTQSNVISVFGDSEVNKYSVPSDNGIIILNAVYVDNDENIWLASNGKGIYKFQSDSVLNLREEEGLYSDYCYDLSGDGKGNLWVLHRNGLSSVDKEYLTIRTVQQFTKLSTDDYYLKNGISVGADSSLYFALSKGIVRYQTYFDARKSGPPKLHIRAVSFNGKEYLQNFPLKLYPGKYKLKVDYIGLSLKDPEQVSYQYRLIGYDNEWADITNKQEVIFSNLNAGNYTFEIVAANSDGIISEPQTYNFRIAVSIWRQWWFYALSAVALATLIVLYVKRREYKLIRYNQQLEQGVKDRTRKIQRQKNEIEEQGVLLAKKNLDITDSIKYASTIQAAIFPPEVILEEALPEHFLINKPKDIVSGDFCWYTKCEDKYIIAVTDCTGHGVPGAIMSMLGITLFNEVVNNLKVTKAGHILEIVRDKVISALNQHKKENPSYDGMNVGLCVLDRAKGTIEYAGAFHNLIYFSDNEMKMVKAERTSVGFTPLGSPSFQTHTITYKKGDMFYLFSDGYQDQFGGENDRKFTSRRLVNILTKISDKKIADQKLVLVQTLDHWMGDSEQTDDIIVLGFRL